MVCQICGKGVATVHLTEIRDAEVKEMHLCEECARKKGLEGSLGPPFEISDLLSGLVETAEGVEEEAAEVRCPNCGLSYADFKKLGRLGCATCYETFNKHLIPLLKNIHGANVHVGKSPVQVKGKKVTPIISKLKARLEKAIQEEAFEEAVRLRDKIRELEEKRK